MLRDQKEENSRQQKKNCCCVVDLVGNGFRRALFIRLMRIDAEYPSEWVSKGRTRQKGRGITRSERED